MCKCEKDEYCSYCGTSKNDKIKKEGINNAK